MFLLKWNVSLKMEFLLLLPTIYTSAFFNIGKVNHAAYPMSLLYLKRRNWRSWVLKPNEPGVPSLSDSSVQLLSSPWSEIPWISENNVAARGRNADQLCLKLADVGMVSGPGRSAADSIFMAAITPQLSWGWEEASSFMGSFPNWAQDLSRVSHLPQVLRTKWHCSLLPWKTSSPLSPRAGSLWGPHRRTLVQAGVITPGCPSGRYSKEQERGEQP